jgi:hypothetical protein
MADNPQIDILSLPDASKKSIDFLDSSFFKVHGPARRLPTLAEVTALLEPGSNRTQPPPIRFKELDLLVKFGSHVSVSEAQCLWVIRRTLGNHVPVPEVYAWRVDGRQVFHLHAAHSRAYSKGPVGLSGYLRPHSYLP